MKASAWLRTKSGASLIIDTSTDFRHQMLRAKVERIDGVLFTHHHADHILGLDDLRSFNFAQSSSIPCYGRQETLEGISEIFRYTLQPDPQHVGGKVAALDLRVFPPYGKLQIGGEEIHSFLLEHGRTLVTGFRYGSIAYATDCHAIPEASRAILAGIDTLVLGALRDRPHPAHFTIEAASKVAKELGIRRCVLTHLSHDVEYEERSRQLPAGVELAFDGMLLDGI
jgi:phosphoribosyl 1,2-cyclic phosphate phosphodiesterase